MPDKICLEFSAEFPINIKRFLHRAHPVVRRSGSFALLPDVEVGVRVLLLHRALEPVVLIGRVVGHEVKDQLQAAVLHSGDEFLNEF